MSLTHNELRKMLNRNRREQYNRLYTACEIAATALFLVGWAVSIITHIGG